MTAEAVSTETPENTRKLAAKNEGEVLRAVARVTQTHAAACMGVHGSTVSRLIEEHLPRFALLLASAGLQVTPVGSLVVDPCEVDALESLAFKYLEARRQERMSAVTNGAGR